MQNKIKLFIYGGVGISVPFLVRTTVDSYIVRNISSPYLTVYFNSLDLVLFFLFIAAFWKSKRIPFSTNKVVDKLWISLFLLLFAQSFYTQYPLISWFWSVRLFLGVSWIWYIFRLRVFVINLKFVIAGLLLGMVGQFIITLTQFVTQKNIGLPLVIEPVLSPNLSGVAKVDLLNNVLVRGYGTFPHPNILAFVSIISILAIYAKSLSKKYVFLLFSIILLGSGMIDHYIITSVQAYVAILMVLPYIFYGQYLRLGFMSRRFMLIILHSLVALSFSKWAIFTLIFMDIFYLTFSRPSKLFHVEQFKNIKFLFSKIFINTISLMGGLTLIFLPYQQIWSTASKRVLYIQDSISMISKNLWFGVGLGQYVANLSSSREFWQYEPVHNVFLLVLSEIGVLGLALLLVILLICYYSFVHGHKN